MRIDSPRRRQHLAAIAERLPEHVARLSWSAERLKVERQAKLRETLAHAVARSPWHRRRLAVRPRLLHLGGQAVHRLVRAFIAFVPAARPRWMQLMRVSCQGGRGGSPAHHVHEEGHSPERGLRPALHLHREDGCADGA